MSDPSSRLETRLAVAGCTPDPATGAVTPPIHFSTTFDRAPDGSYPSGLVYSRNGNPTRNLFEAVLADAEGGSACAAFSSGMAAANAVIAALCPGGHVLVPNDVYHGVRHLLGTTWAEWGLTVDEVDYRGDWMAALRPETKLIWMETPSNPLAQITDIKAVASEAASRGLISLVDATWTTPLLQRPLELGADLVLHSTTKYLGGHSDVLGGAIVAAKDGDAFGRIRHVQVHGGAVMDPFSAWLTLRGMRSLAARLPRQCSTARRIATFLDDHPAVELVHYPGLESHPGHALAANQMADFGAMLSFEVPGGRPRAFEIAERLRLFRTATSLGGTESLIEHRASVEPEPAVSPEGLLRLSIGLEHEDDLVADLDHALAR